MTEKVELTKDELYIIRDHRARVALKEGSPDLYKVENQIVRAIKDLAELGRLVGSDRWDVVLKAIEGL